MTGVEAVSRVDQLSLRVSAAALARVLFPHSGTDGLMLALEHRAAVRGAPSNLKTELRAQPFGGAVRIQDLDRFESAVGDFKFDSDRSRSEKDFRILVSPASLGPIHDLCVRAWQGDSDSPFETDPMRELSEEFEEALGVQARPDWLHSRRTGLVFETMSAPTDNLRAEGMPTARIYWTYEIRVLDPGLQEAMLQSSAATTPADLRRMAIEDYRAGGNGRANSVLAIGLELVREAYMPLTPEARGSDLQFGSTRLAGNVAAILEGLSVAKYRFVP